MHLFIKAIAAILSDPFFTLTCQSFGSLIEGKYFLYSLCSSYKYLGSSWSDSRPLELDSSSESSSSSSSKDCLSEL
jgi:hypothetical protein